MADFHFYEFDSEQYAADFQTLLRCYGEQKGTNALLEHLLARYPREAVVVDWGAGSGYLTRRLLQRFDTVYAVEPSPAMRAVLQRDCPAARIIPGTITEADVPDRVDVGFIRHVYYHVPDHLWGPYTLRAAARLSPDGLLVVTLKHPDSFCNAMIEDLGGPRFNLFTLNDTFRRHPEYRVEYITVPGPIVTSSFEETCAIARFMLADRPSDAYPRRFSQEEFEEYVRRHLWNEAAKQGGWRVDSVWFLIRRNEFWQE
jgi:SAM-dependent methyltransferase